jgi:hypothetical protein
MTRKQIAELSLDELRILRWKYLDTKGQNRSHLDDVRRTLKRIEAEIHVKRYTT